MASLDNGDVQLTGGALNAAVARAAVQIHSRMLGRGPIRAQAFYRERVIVILLEDTLTQAERSLTQDGHADTVLALRREYQATMKRALVSAIEELTGRSVVAFMSGSHVDPDMSCEVFALDRSVGRA
jgi:uncharacterized protein YbcI